MNAYETKRAERIERLRARGDKLASASTAAGNAAHAILDRIPMGQPILTDHHSAKRHRRDLDKAHQRLTKAVELRAEAEAVERRADRAEANVDVSSDDPEAVAKLREKLAKLDHDRARMVAANKAVRSASPLAALEAAGFSAKVAAEILTPDFVGRVGFPAYVLSNIASEARRIRLRIEALETRAASPAVPGEELHGITIREEENRVRILFPGKPDEQTRAALKRAAFRWSPTDGASPARSHRRKRNPHDDPFLYDGERSPHRVRAHAEGRRFLASARGDGR
jgi:hypothetical protein